TCGGAPRCNCDCGSHGAAGGNCAASCSGAAGLAGPPLGASLAGVVLGIGGARGMLWGPAVLAPPGQCSGAAHGPGTAATSARACSCARGAAGARACDGTLRAAAALSLQLLHAETLLQPRPRVLVPHPRQAATPFQQLVVRAVLEQLFAVEVAGVDMPS